MKIKKPLELKCECGAVMSIKDAEFWGECKNCQSRLPLQTRQTGDSGGSTADRNFHGGQGNRGEW